jgi:hypothetical protein
MSEFVRAQMSEVAATGEAGASEEAVTAAIAEEHAVAANVVGDPTVLFAAYGDLFLYLPVAGAELTEIGFHQASGDRALSMQSLLPYADTEQAIRDHGTGRTVDDACCPDNPHVLGGKALRMWRSNRTGPPDTAVDVGADPGTQVYAPLSGTVLEVRPYWLYGTYEDYEIHITPNGYPELDLVLIHVDEVTVAKGDEVIGGVTPIAKIRNLSDQVNLQLAQFDEHGGNHTHMQLNRLEAPGVLPDLDEP